MRASPQERVTAPEGELACIRDWKIIGIALATAAGAVEAMILAQNPELALGSVTLSDNRGVTK